MICNFFSDIWTSILKYYKEYSNFVHSILPNEAGDFLEILIDAIIVLVLIKVIAGNAFKSTK